MFGYITLGAKDFEAGLKFYDTVMAVLGQERQYADAESGWAAWGVPPAPQLMICKPFDGGPVSAGNGTMIGFSAASTETVDRFHAAALAAGGTDEGGPGTRPHYSPEFYVAYVRDPSGNKLCAYHMMAG